VLTTIWRLRPLGVPVWPVACTGCAASFLESTGRFRVNANGRLHDVWLIYRCPRCQTRRKREIHRRVRADAPGIDLDRYRADDPELAEACAFALSPGQPVPYRVERPVLPADGALLVTIVQPRGCAVRWDRFLAEQLGWSRSRVVAAWREGAVRVEPRARPNQLVRDGQRLRLSACGARCPDRE
jgi:hypothetical protein